MMRIVQPWDVFHIPHGNGVKPKFYVALQRQQRLEYGQYIEAWNGFYINSNPQRLELLTGDENLQVCDVRLSANTYRAFLKQDSFVNVGELITCYSGELLERVDYIRRNDKERILDSVERCPVLERKQKDEILRLREPSAEKT